MIKSIHICFLLCLLIAIGSTPLHAQYNTQAVMQVSVEVIPGSRVVSSSEGDIMLAMVDSDTHNKVYVDIGRHTLRSPAGMDIYVSSEEIIETNSDTGDMQIVMEVNQHRTDNGELTLLLNGTVDTRGVEFGVYIGNQLTRVEYD